MGDNSLNGSNDSENEFWIFGYGSLIWKPPPHFDRRIPGYVTGYVRRFWQHQHPPKVWGTAYRIPAPKVAEVRTYLDIREINGYTIHYTPFYPSSPSSDPSTPQPTIKTLVYIGTPDNAQFTGPQDPQELAEHIWKSEGPSGLNRDYLWSLDIALDELSPESGDEHVKDLADRVRKIAESQLGVEAEASHTKAIDHELKKVASTDAQEETEK
ncbi:hypothetical protein DID88_007603 [Monilinia fructigena]|uniref:glutathione-specific gamma-glutamylcyclotransferase n=1 Tax=Monilinia fructigena TaxID=38457 RepID=A0A395J2V7_9HELO|nr:hypothetical protein DID88_007603 [Monilinia fructigena]